jgi:hypothetical protein
MMQEVVLTPPELFAAMMSSMQAITIDGKRVRVQHDPQDLFVVINLRNSLGSQVIQANDQQINVF